MTTSSQIFARVRIIMHFCVGLGALMDVLKDVAALPKGHPFHGILTSEDIDAFKIRSGCCDHAAAYAHMINNGKTRVCETVQVNLT